jgi:hypothetical protein
VTRRSSAPLVGALIVSILGAGVTRSMVLKQRHELDVARNSAATANADLSKVNSFALGLLLGGLRGPLVMALWTSSENQKTDRDLEDFDTKVELIRLLQPEFDTVHLFQIWNKAYNISVQMANVPNKYTTILDALAYGFSVDRERPCTILLRPTFPSSSPNVTRSRDLKAVRGGHCGVAAAIRNACSN